MCRRTLSKAQVLILELAVPLVSFSLPETQSVLVPACHLARALPPAHCPLCALYEVILTSHTERKFRERCKMNASVPYGRSEQQPILRCGISQTRMAAVAC